jgi:hypothetical protein
MSTSKLTGTLELEATTQTDLSKPNFFDKDFSVQKGRVVINSLWIELGEFLTLNFGR